MVHVHLHNMPGHKEEMQFLNLLKKTALSQFPNVQEWERNKRGLPEESV